jgi:hypothetical protein
MKTHIRGFGAFFSHSDNNLPMASFLGRFAFPRCRGEVVG